MKQKSQLRLDRPSKIKLVSTKKDKLNKIRNTELEDEMRFPEHMYKGNFEDLEDLDGL